MTADGSRRDGGPECSLEPLIARIAELEHSGRTWSLKASEVRGLLGLESADFHRRLYQAERSGNRLVGLESAGRLYSQENVGELVSLLELFCGPAAEGHLERAGIFFPHPEQVELMGLFLGAVGEALARHLVEQKEFSAMLAAFRDFRRAAQVYREQYFPLEGLLQESAQRYCARRAFQLPELARANARRLLDYFFRKHVLEAESLFAPLFERLREQAVREGYAQPPPREESREQARRGQRSGQPQTPEAGSAERARRLMGLEGDGLDLHRLKSRYKELMKIYHPDLNPQGLRRCQEINAAYALLSATLSWRP